MPVGDLRNIGREALGPVWAREDIPTEKMAAALGVSRQAISQRAKSLGLPSRASVRGKKGDDALFVTLWEAGVRPADIMRYLGYSCRQCVTQRRRMLGLPPRRGTGLRMISIEQFLNDRAQERLRERMERDAACGPRGREAA